MGFIARWACPGRAAPAPTPGTAHDRYLQRQSLVRARHLRWPIRMCLLALAQRGKRQQCMHASADACHAVLCHAGSWPFQGHRAGSDPYNVGAARKPGFPRRDWTSWHARTHVCQAAPLCNAMTPRSASLPVAAGRPIAVTISSASRSHGQPRQTPACWCGTRDGGLQEAAGFKPWYARGLRGTTYLGDDC
jgi:hypothetical protein